MKKVAITLTNNGKSFQLVHALKASKNSEGLWRYTVGNRIAIAKNAKALIPLADGFELLNQPAAGDRYFMKGTRQPDGSIIDPILDWEGNQVGQNVR